MSSAHTGTIRGVSASLGASAFFGIIFLLSGLVSASAEYIFAWRVLVTLACYATVLVIAGGRRTLREYWKFLRAKRSRPWLTVLLAVMVGTQLWLFVWAPANGQALDASLGFLLLPISLVIGGRFVFKSHISRIQWVSISIAVLAVAIKLALTASISWVTVFIALVYPLYFMLRRHAGLDHPAGFGLEVAVMTPLAIALVILLPFEAEPAQVAGIGAIALCGALAMAAYLAASRLLPLPLFGMLSYVEPLLLVLIALVLGERLDGADLLVYGLLAFALGLLAVEALLAMRARGTARNIRR